MKKKFRRTIKGYSSEQTIKNDLKRLLRKSMPYDIDVNVLQPYRYLQMVAVNIGSTFGYELGIVFDEIPELHNIYNESHKKFIKIATTRGFYSVAQSDIRPITVQMHSLYQNNGKACKSHTKILIMSTKNIVLELVNIIKYIGNSNSNLTKNEMNLLAYKKPKDSATFLTSIIHNIIPEMDTFIKANQKILTTFFNKKNYFQQNTLLNHIKQTSEVSIDNTKELYPDSLVFLLNSDQEDENKIRNILKNIIIRSIPTKLTANIISFHCETEHESEQLIQILKKQHQYKVLPTYKNRLQLQKRFFLEEEHVNNPFPRVQQKTSMKQIPNKKRFSSEFKNDPWFIKYYHEKLLQEVTKKDACDSQSLQTIVNDSLEVIVSLHPGKYQKCIAHSISKTNELIVRDSTKTLHNVPLHLFHVHPVITCQEIKLGNAVFIHNNSSDYYDSGHVIDINNDILTIQPWDSINKCLIGKEIKISEKEVIPLRSQLKKSDSLQKYASMQSYQKFVRSFQQLSRVQRGMLLYHEMGSGKSRTAIETLQSYLQERWFHSQKYKNVNNAKDYVDVWGQSRWGILISPNSDAKNHFLDEVALWLSPHWSWIESKQLWIPFQHIFTSLTKEGLLKEIEEHTKHFRTFFIDSNENRPPIIKTIVHDNTNNFYSIRKKISDRQTQHNEENSQQIKKFFGIEHYKNIGNDSHYSQFFSNCFIIIDEIHNVSNMIENAQHEDQSGAVGMFLYKSMMEANKCKILGLTGTPIQRTAVSMAPLFNILHGKIIKEKWCFNNIVHSDIVIEDLKNIFKKYVQTVWEHSYDIKKKQLTIHVTPHPDHIDWIHHTSHNNYRKQLITNLEKKKIEFKKTPDSLEYELFPFAFKQGIHSSHKYTFDDLSFESTYIHNNEKIIHVPDFLKRIIGYVSYIFPPKQKSQYPDQTITTEKVVAKADHIKYIREVRDRLQTTTLDGTPDITGSLKARGADATRACNINWFAISDEIHQYPPIGQWLKQEGKYYGQQLIKYYYKFQNDSKFTRYLMLSDQVKNGKLEDFSPKMALILKDINNQKTPFANKSVIYSRWVDGTNDTSSPLFSSPHDQELYHDYQDKNGIGFGGLKVFSIVLDLAGWLCLEFEKRKSRDGNSYYYFTQKTKDELLTKVGNHYKPVYIRFGYLDKKNKENKTVSKNQADIKSLQKAIFNLVKIQDSKELSLRGASQELIEDIQSVLKIRAINDKQHGNKYGELIRTILISASITEGIEFLHVRQMHILEPPDDYKTLDQMFSRSIRLNSHKGLDNDEKHVNIKVYMLTIFNENQPWEKKKTRHSLGFIKTADEMNWGTIERKILISEQFYSVMKYAAIDCSHNLINNQKSRQDKYLFCYDYPYENSEEYDSSESVLYNPFKQPHTLKSSKINLKKLTNDLKQQALLTKKNKRDTRLRIPYLSKKDKLRLQDKKRCAENEKELRKILQKKAFKDIIYIGDEGSPLHSHIYQIWSTGKNKWNIRTLESNSSVKEIKGTLKDIVKYIETIEKERQEQFNKFQDDLNDIEF